MWRFILRRLAFGVFAVLGASIVVFGLSRLQGDPRYLFLGEEDYGVSQEVWDRWGEQMGLNRPLVAQYGIWLAGVARGDFGKSILTRQPVIEMIRDRAGATVQLALGAWLFGTIVGVPLGIYSALRRGTALDYATRGFALLGQSLPMFWVALMGILLFAVSLGWLPTGTRGEGEIKYYLLPSLILGWAPAAGKLRLTRSSMLEVLDSEYVKFARAKGVGPARVLWKHAFRNAILAPLTFSALLLLGFLDGAVVIETVFSWPGLGRLAVESIFFTDYPTLSALVLIIAVMNISVVLMLDILYVALDPRIRLG